MSLTQHIRQKTKVYKAIARNLNLKFISEIIDHHNAQLSKIVHKPKKDTNFLLAGSGVIYALRDYLGGKALWEQTIPSESFYYPDDIPTPYRWVAMAVMEDCVRKQKSLDIKNSLGLELQPTVDDVAQIANSFDVVFGSSNALSTYIAENNTVHLNPTFPASHLIGGADANMILGNTLWDIRTTARRKPLDLDTVIQQIGYWLLDAGDTYRLRQVGWYYSRQECLFTYDLQSFLKCPKSEAENKLTDVLVETHGQKTRLIEDAKLWKKVKESKLKK